MNRISKDFIVKNLKNLHEIDIGSLEKYPEKVIQFGEGNFLRGFVDWQFNELIKANLFKGSIIIVQPIKEGTINELNDQDGIYTLLQRGTVNGEPTERTYIISCISRGINPYKNWDKYLELADNPELRFIVSNTTEVGIMYSDTPKNFDTCPESFPAKVTILLYKRYKKFKGDKTKGFIFLPCELIEKNGDKLKSNIINHAIDWNLESDFIRWIEEDNYFCNTLVDRITPGFPKEEIDTITQRLGYQDKLLVTSELFYRWVIQDDEIVQKELPFSKANLNVIWTDNVTPYCTLKVRILNGMHSMFTIPSFLCGNNTVNESMKDEIINGFIRQGLFNEIMPTLEFPEKEKEQFANTALERFENPFIKHYLLTMTLNSISKFKVRVLPSILKYYEMMKKPPKILTFSLAALIYFYRGYPDNDGNYVGERLGEKYIIRDDGHIFKIFIDTYDRFDNDTEKICRKILSSEAIWDTDLSILSDLTRDIITNYQNIYDKGMRKSIQELILS